MRFEKIYIELSDICGLNCGFCPSVKGVRGAMSAEKFGKDIIFFTFTKLFRRFFPEKYQKSYYVKYCNCSGVYV